MDQSPNLYFLLRAYGNPNQNSVKISRRSKTVQFIFAQWPHLFELQAVQSGGRTAIMMKEVMVSDDKSKHHWPPFLLFQT